MRDGDLTDAERMEDEGDGLRLSRNTKTETGSGAAWYNISVPPKITGLSKHAFLLLLLEMLVFGLKDKNFASINLIQLNTS